MSRPEFAVVVTGMGFGWVLAGFSQWLGTGLIAAHLTLIATDCLGAWAPNRWVALGLGAAWGAICADQSVSGQQRRGKKKRDWSMPDLPLCKCGMGLF